MLSNQEGKLQNKYVKDYVLFDLETTGTSSRTDEVVEIAAVKVLNENITEEFSSLVHPGRPIPFWATQVNGITDDMVEDAPCLKDVLEDFLVFSGNLPFVGHNIHAFDMKFVYRDCQRYFGLVPDNDYIDTLKLARIYLPQLSHHRLSDLADYYSVSYEGAHRALIDCRINQKVFAGLAGEMTLESITKNGMKQCPACGSVLKLRNGRFGKFLGCSAYPGCTYTENPNSGL